MPNTASVHLKGFRELDDTLRGLPNRLAGQALTAATRAGAVPVRDEAKRLAPRDTGNLRRSITIRVNKRSRTGITMSIGFLKRAWYGALVELGVAPHEIRSDTSMAGDDGTFYGKAVRHPGHGPRPFLRPALDNQGDEAIRRMKARLFAEIEKIARKTVAASRSARAQFAGRR